MYVKYKAFYCICIQEHGLFGEFWKTTEWIKALNVMKIVRAVYEQMPKNRRVRKSNQ